MGNLWQRINSYLASPIVGQVDTYHLFLATGLVILASMAWGMILGHVLSAARELEGAA